MDKLQLKEAILKRIRRPEILQAEYPAEDLGVLPDTGKIQTAALQKAIDRVHDQGGGRLVLPAGRYYTGALRLKSGVELHLASGETVLSFVNENVELHYPLVYSHWEATPCYNFSPLIYACDATDVAVTGPGILDGGADGDHWWNWHHQVENAWSDDRPDLQLPDRTLLRQMNVEGVPEADRVFGPGHFLRPNFIQMIRCERVLLAGFTLKNSPMWQLNPVLCSSLTVDGVTMSSHGPNNDGCDPESCDGVQIVNCRFDTGDDCISLKSGRDRDGRIAARACQYVLIENNEFADGHGGIALGSEMSGGIRRVLAMNNRFSSPSLTYALRLKTNARRGGQVEDIILADSVMEHVHGAAVHGTMLYEDGRNGSDLPVFRNLTIENVEAHGGDYGIFLEAFDEVPITGLVLRNIRIDGVRRPMRGMNWNDPVVEQVYINGLRFPRPGQVRILGVPHAGNPVRGFAEHCGGREACRFRWEICSGREKLWTDAGEGETLLVPEQAAWVRVTAVDALGNQETGIPYRVLPAAAEGTEETRSRLVCREMLEPDDRTPDETVISRQRLAGMMLPLMGRSRESTKLSSDPGLALELAVEYRFLAPDETGGLCPEGTVSRQEMATVAMQACGVNYRNASSTMPVCRDSGMVGNHYGTNVARALYFGFMELDREGYFWPDRGVTMGEAVEILNRVADFAGL